MVTRKLLHLCDQHISPRYKDSRCLNLSLEAIKIVCPDIIVLGGDLIDCFSVSRFDKGADKLDSLQWEINRGYDYLWDVREAAPRAEIHYTLGNHENRLNKYIARNAPGLGTLRGLEISELLRTEELGISVYPYGKGPKIGGVWFTHGSLVRKWGGMSANGMIATCNSSVAMGHSHRLAGMKVRRGNSVYSGYESGCLCSLHPDYMDFNPDWQQGFSLFLLPEKGDHRWVPVHLTGAKPLALLKTLSQ